MSAYAFVLTWVLQSTVLALLALLLPVLFRLRDPKVLALWWQSTAVLVVLLPLLPLLGPRQPVVPGAVITFVEHATAAMAPALGASATVSPRQWLLALWAVGVVGRFAWLVTGQRRLRRLAASGVQVQDDPALVRARALAPAAALPPLAPARVPVVSVDNAGPCAFGWIDVCVLVPGELRKRPEQERLAVYLHELAHIARADVGRVYADEAWRLLWWWQPGVWLALAQLRLAREHEVDAVVVERTGGTRAYVEALLWCSSLPRAGAPSMPVASRRHALVRRVAVMCEGAQMTRTRRWVSASAMVLTFSGVAGVISMVSPLRAAGLLQGTAIDAQEPGPLERAAVRPTLDTPAPRRTVSVEAEWPDGATSYRFRTHLVIDANGRVAEARLVEAPATSAVPADIATQFASAREAALNAVRQWQFESPLRAPMLLVTDVAVGSGTPWAAHLDRTGRSLGELAARGRAPLRVGGNIGPPRKVVDVQPVYPPAALDAHVSGVVIIEATIDRGGQVSDARVLRSIPLLDQAALTAVRSWQYEPTWINGDPVPVIMVLTVHFSLDR